MNYDVIAEYVLAIACVFAQRNYQSRSMSLIRWVLEVINNVETPLLKLEKLNDCCGAVKDNLKSLYSAGNVTDIRQYCAPLLEQIRKKIKQVQTDDVVYKADKEAQCMSGLGACYCCYNSSRPALEMFQAAVLLMKSVAGEKGAKTYRVVAHCYFNIAIVNEQMGKQEEVKRFCKQAIETYKCVKNITEEERKMEIADIKERFEQLLSKNNSVSLPTSVNMMTGATTSAVEDNPNISGLSEASTSREHADEGSIPSCKNRHGRLIKRPARYRDLNM